MSDHDNQSNQDVHDVPEPTITADRGDLGSPAGGVTTFGAGVHPVNVAHLVMGIAFAGLVVIWALFMSDAVQGHDLRWLLPIPWVAAGVAGLVATAPRLRGRPQD
jgi:hypothetical protein